MAFDPVVFENASQVRKDLGEQHDPTDGTPKSSDAKFTGSSDAQHGTVTQHSLEHTDPMDMPPVPGGADHPGKGTTRVHTEALDTFTKNLRSLQGDLDAVRSGLNGQDLVVKPGMFATAQSKIAQPINGSGGLREFLVTTLDDFRSQLGQTISAVESARTNYANNEDMNKMSAEKYTEYFGSLPTS